MIDPVISAAAAAQFERVPGIAPISETAVAKSSFAEWMNKEMNTLNGQIQQADANLRAFAVGEATNIHELMMSLEKAKLSFQLTLQVRNKLLQAYQDVMRMQI